MLITGASHLLNQLVTFTLGLAVMIWKAYLKNNLYSSSEISITYSHSPLNLLYLSYSAMVSAHTSFCRKAVLKVKLVGEIYSLAHRGEDSSNVLFSGLIHHLFWGSTGPQNSTACLGHAVVQTEGSTFPYPRSQPGLWVFRSDLHLWGLLKNPASQICC